MTRKFESNEIRQQYIDKLGAKFGTMLADIHEEWALALDRYQELMDLFGTSKERVALLNALGSAFFGDLQEVLSNDLILRLTRLTDTGSRSVSVHHLPKLLRKKPDLQEQVAEHVSQAKEHVKSARNRRNHRIAHRDRTQPVRPVNYKDLKAGLDSVYAALNAVEMGIWKNHLQNEVISELRTAEFAVRLESLVKGVLYIESRIDPTGETEPFDDDVTKAFLAKIGGDPQRDQVAIQSLRIAARHIKKRLDQSTSGGGSEN